jgi:phenylacetate-CoA ligase
VTESESIRAAQLDRLRELIAALVPANRFYGPRLEAAGLIDGVGSLDEFSAKMPFTMKADLVADQEAHPPYGTNHTYPIEHYTRFCQTSGTTARPLAILDTSESWEWMLGNWREIYQAAGVGPGSRLYFAFSFGPFLGFWTAFEAAVKLGCLCLPGGGLTTGARLHALLEYQADVLCCTPTYALHLGEEAVRAGVDLSRSAVRRIIVAGEPGGSLTSSRERLAELWHGAEVIDHYGMTEVGPVAYQVSGDPGVLHIIDRSYYAEIVDPGRGRPVPYGEIGELVLTTLGRTACPLLRYRTGDLVRRSPVAGGCVLAAGIIGRVDDMVVVRGVNLYPSAIEAVIRSVPGISEYRVEVNRSDALVEVSLEVECVDASAVTALSRALAASFSLRIPVRQVPEGTLPRFEMKARRWVVRNSTK